MGYRSSPTSDKLWDELIKKHQGKLEEETLKKRQDLGAKNHD